MDRALRPLNNRRVQVAAGVAGAAFGFNQLYQAGQNLHQIGQNIGNAVNNRRVVRPRGQENQDPRDRSPIRDQMERREEDWDNGEEDMDVEKAGGNGGSDTILGSGGNSGRGISSRKGNFNIPRGIPLFHTLEFEVDELSPLCRVTLKGREVQYFLPFMLNTYYDQTSLRQNSYFLDVLTNSVNYC